MVRKTVEKFKNAVKDLESQQQLAVDSMPIGLPAGFPAPKAGKLSLRHVAIVGSISPEASKQERAEISRRIATSLSKTALAEADTIALRALQFTGAESRPREDASVNPTAKDLIPASGLRLRGKVHDNVTEVIGQKLTPETVESHLPWVEASIGQAGYERSRTLGFIGVIGASRLGQEFGVEPMNFRDGGVLVLSETGNRWHQVAIGGQLGLLRAGA
jgi:hypothetical protein